MNELAQTPLYELAHLAAVWPPWVIWLDSGLQNLIGLGLAHIIIDSAAMAEHPQTIHLSYISGFVYPCSKKFWFPTQKKKSDFL